MDSLLTHLPADRPDEMVGLIQGFPVLFSDPPTNLIEHDIVSGSIEFLQRDGVVWMLRLGTCRIVI